MKKIKAICFDVDGVLITPPHYFSTELEMQGRYLNVAETLKPYFTGQDEPCLEGKADAKKVLQPFLDAMNWEGTVEDHMKEWFEFEARYQDLKLLDIVNDLRNKGVKCYLTTDQEKHRAKYLSEKLGFRNRFDQQFYSCHLGYRKCHEEYWKQVLSLIQKDIQDILPEEIAYFDDSQSNIDVASGFGIKAILYTDFRKFKNDFDELKF
jgi:putative hydrolase of the HAD superfamily